MAPNLLVADSCAPSCDPGKLESDALDAKALRPPLMNCFRLLLTKHRGRNARAGVTLDLGYVGELNFNFHHSLLGVGGAEIWDDHRRRLFGDH